MPLETLKDRSRRWIVQERTERFWQLEEDERGLAAAALKRQRKREEKERLQRRHEIDARNERTLREMVAKWKAEQAERQRQEDERAEELRQAHEREEKRIDSLHAAEVELVSQLATHLL